MYLDVIIGEKILNLWVSLKIVSPVNFHYDSKILFS